MVAVVSATVCARLAFAVVSGISVNEQQSDSLSRSAGLAGLDLTDPELRVPAPSVAGLWREAIRVTGNRHVGFHAGSRIRSGMLGVVDYAARCGSTLQEFFLRLSRYRRLIADGLDLRLLQRGEQIRIAFDIPLDGIEARRQMNEFFAAALLALGRDATGVHWKPERVAFRHSTVAEDAGLKAWFGTELNYRESVCSMQLSAEVLGLPLTRAEPGLAMLLDRFAQDSLARLPEPDDLALRVRYAISNQLWAGECSLEAVARTLCMSPRSLQRRLQDCGTSFNTLVDNARRDAALELILDPAITVSDIAVRTGFSEPSAFDRAFRRWTGSSPGNYRRMQGHAQARPQALS